MRYQYKQISCYYSKGERILLLPKGEILPFGGGIDIEPVFELKLPVGKDELERKMNECFTFCWSKTVNGFPKGASIVEKYLKVKGFKKVVQQFELFELTYNIAEKKYDLRKLLKAADYKCYSGMEIIEMGSAIDFDFIMNLISA